MNAASRKGLARGELVEQRAGVQNLDVLERRRDHDHQACTEREGSLPCAPAPGSRPAQASARPTARSRTARREARLECCSLFATARARCPSRSRSGQQQGDSPMVVDHRHELGTRGHFRPSRTVSRAILTRSYSASIRAMSSSAPSRIPDLARASSWRLSSERLDAPNVAPLDFSVCAARRTSSVWPCSSPRLAASTSPRRSGTCR